MTKPDLSTTAFRRRAFLGGAVGLAALGIVGCAKGSPPETNSAGNGKSGIDVIVIGAGSAGVAAARELRDAGKNVVVLEARDRIGGRMWTDRTIMTIPHERGASLCHGGPDTATWPWAQKLGIKDRKFVQNMSRYTPSTPWVRWDSPEFYEFPEGTPKIAMPLPEPKGSETATQYLQRLGIDKTNYPLALLGIQVDHEQFDAYPAAEIVETLTSCFDVSKTGKIEPDGYAGDFKLLAPYDEIPTAVAEGVDIRYNTVVNTIQYSENGVTVQAGPETFEASKCVVAVPIGVLQHDDITFDPPLESDRRKTIDGIQQTVAFKTILEFDHPVRPEGFDMVNQHDVGPCQFWDESTGMPGYDGQLIVAWDTGDRARELLALPEEQRFAAALEGVHKLTGDRGLRYINASNYDWRNDKFAYGAYATGERHPEVIYKPMKDTVFWAGAIMSSVAKAHSSGLDAAKTTLAVLK
ncbi:MULTISPECIES: NAD(P)/FAD-dependent oxidoreductase [unclassified Mycolicibacterium]|uniref:flavin monoamine oxidase family protein n=1 Tax=unclassified Mycolicibacterium TaxID=2636767 RepID=UPI001F4C4312|nr:NAD(P)/FAD-dependent oxidoreductase [Mycolicibacterium sp. YH-1]UNB53950.1 FAD-dependent oxidoreductase [Mycolicibacterium sp. YH-1]